MGSSLKRKANPEYDRLHGQIQRFKRKHAAVWDALSDDEKKQHAATLKQMKAEQRRIPSRPLREEYYKSLHYVRYADDFIIGVIGSKEDAENLKADLAVFLKEKMGLTLSDEKTKITHSAERARFLGYDISVSRSQEIRRKKNGVKARLYTGVVKLYVPHEKWESKLRGWCNPYHQKPGWKRPMGGYSQKLIMDIEILRTMQKSGAIQLLLTGMAPSTISKFSSW